MSGVRTKIRQDILYLLKEVIKDALDNSETLKDSEMNEIKESVYHDLLKSCNAKLDRIEGRA